MMRNAQKNAAVTVLCFRKLSIESFGNDSSFKKRYGFPGGSPPGRIKNMTGERQILT